MSMLLYPGTFDPITLGHQNLVERASQLFDTVTVAVAQSTRKNPMFSLDRRVSMAQNALSNLDNVEVIGFSGLIMDLVRDTGANAVLRGLRSMTDFDYEMAMAMTNKAVIPEFETLFMCPEPTYSHISSTFVREISALGGDVSQFIHPSVNEILVNEIAEKNKS
ncbi:MAG: pantetheine-phosphate adenylyltransferase [Pseudomonadota bacterium]